MWRQRTWAVVLAALLGGVGADPARARANDMWESDPAEDGNGTTNILRHGVVQLLHDMDGGSDQDWSRVVTRARHSYEARVSGLRWQGFCAASPCANRFDRVDAAGVQLQGSGVSSDDPWVGVGPYSLGRSVRWIAATGAQEYLRVTAGNDGQPDEGVYDIAFFDTTLFVPRWNNTATQITVLLLQNTSNETVGGFLYFHDDGGALRATVAVTVPRHGLQVISTASIPALAGSSGSATIAHLGGYAALAGKAVALEPATGFTFDTPITPLSR
jgi:hypothetical protein